MVQMTENLYESLAPECDLSRERSSLPYYGSETESDIYCPYTFVNSQKVFHLVFFYQTTISSTVLRKTFEDYHKIEIVYLMSFARHVKYAQLCI